MNPKIMAAMNELNSMNWEQYLTPPKSKPITNSISLQENSTKSIESLPNENIERTRGDTYSGYVFQDISQELNLESKSTIDKHQQRSDSDLQRQQPEQTSQPEEDYDARRGKYDDENKVSGDDDYAVNNKNQPHPDHENEKDNDIDNENCGDDLSDNSNEPVLAGENIEADEFELDSPDSLSTKESINDQEILAHNNAIKNKDILHESFLLENNRMIHDSDQNSSINPDSGGNIHQTTSHSIEGDTKSVTFADEDSIYEFDRLDDKSFEKNYPDMNPDSIHTDDREEITRRYMVEAVREEAHRSALKGEKNTHFHSRHDKPEYDDELVLNQSAEEELECQFAREKLDQLIATSPQFRAAILSYSAMPSSSSESKLPPHNGKIKKNKLSDPRRKGVPKKQQSQQSQQQQQQQQPQPPQKINTSGAKPYSESSVADSADSHPLPNSSRSKSLPRLQRIPRGSSSSPSSPPPPFPVRPSSPSPPGGPHASPTVPQQSDPPQDIEETIIMNKTANLEYIYRLAADTVRPSPSIEFAPPPPKLSTDCPKLPFDGILKLAELNLTGDCHCITLHPNEDKIRLKLKYYAFLPDWEFSNRIDFSGLHFFRSEYMIPSSSTSSSLDSPLPNNITTPTNTHPPPTNTKRKLLLSHENIISLLFTNRTKDLRKNSPHLFQFHSFIKETYTGFLCLVLDMRCQLLGTYDHKTKEFFPGLTICFSNLNFNKKKKKNSIETSQANLLEIDLTLLPLETFALIPVLFDDTPYGAKFPEMNFQFDVSVKINENNYEGHTQQHWLASELNETSETTPIHELFDVDIENERRTTTANSHPNHVVDLDPGWNHVESYFCSRATTIPEQHELEGPPVIAIDGTTTQSKIVPFAPQHSYVPFVIFRCLSQNDSTKKNQTTPSHENQRYWGIKTLQESFSGVMFHSIVRGVLESLKRRHILPYHIMNVEHCMRCDLHSMTTWHVPGSYEKWFYDLKRSLRKSLPPAIITSNTFTNTLQNPPRVGSFELSIRPYSSDCTQLIFSKLSSRTLPPTETILRDLAILLIPETIKFNGLHILELHIYNSYSKTPVKGAIISLYQICVEVSLTEDIERDALREMRDVDDFHDQEDDPDESWTTIKKNRHKQRIENAKRNSEVNQARHTHYKQSSTTRGKGVGGGGGGGDHSHPTYSKQFATSHETTHAYLRHSSVYYKVRSWRVEDITAWFKSFSIGSDVIARAVADGLVDGPSFLALANQQSFEKWGVKNKIKLERMNKSLEDILSTNEKTSSTDDGLNSDLPKTHLNYDPFTDTCVNSTMKGTEIKQCQPGKPKPSSRKEDLNLKLITRKQTDSHGLGFISVDTAGTYFFRIESSTTSPYCSNAFQITCSGHTGYCAAMKPRIGRAKITIKLNDQSEMSESGILVSMMNLMSGKRHIAFAKRTSEKVIKEETPVSSRSSNPIKPVPPKRAMTVDVSRSASSSSIIATTTTTATKITTAAPGPHPLMRQNSVGSVLLNEMTNSWKGGSVLISGSLKQSESKISEIETRVLEATIWLPVGKYFSEVNGEVFEVKEEAFILTAEKVHYWNTNENNLEDENDDLSGRSSGRTTNEPVALSFIFKQAQRCHRRILLGSIRIFQKIYRRYKKDFLTTNLWAYLALKKHLRRYLTYVRGIICQRKSTKIGTTFRMYVARKNYLYRLTCIITLQCLFRRYLAKRRFKRVQISRLHVMRVIARYVIKRRRYRQRNAIKIQNKFRQHLAILQRNRRIVQRRILRSLKRWLKYNERVRLHLEELEREGNEREQMREAEEYQIKYLQDYEMEEKRKIREKIRRVERKRNGMALIIQRNYRRYYHEQRYQRLIRGVLKLQRIFRIQIHEQRILRKIPLKYVIGFPSLHKHPQLLGGSKLLLGLPLVPRPPPQPKYIDQILLKLITPPAIKIQSVIRMFLVRRQYIAIRREQMGHDGDENDENENEEASFYPPLFRYLIPPPSPSPPSPLVTPPGIESSGQTDNQEYDELGAIHESTGNGNGNGDGHENDPYDYWNQSPDAHPGYEYTDGNGTYPDYNQTGYYNSHEGLTIEQQQHLAILPIQSLYRGHLARKRFQILRNSIKQKQESSLLNGKDQSPIIKSQSSVIQSIKSFNLVDNLRSLSRTLSSPSSPSPSPSSPLDDKNGSNRSQKPLLRILSKEIVHAMDQSLQAVKGAGDSVLVKYHEKNEQIKENKEKTRNELYRKERLQQNEFCVEDGIFNIKGRPVEIPRLNRLWYVGVFPQLDEYEIDQETIGNEMLSGHDLEQAYEMMHDRLLDEAIRTPPLSPLSKETYEKLNFNLHLADLQRYTRLLIVIFVETSEEMDGRIRTDALPGHVAIPSVKKNKSNETPKFLPLFYGSCQLNGGLAFSPCGGRLLFHLHPNPNQAIIFSKSQAKRLSAIKHIELQGTLIPIAIPSSRFLTTLSDPKATLPHYPGELLDAFLFEKHEIQVKEFYGAAICMIKFHSRNLFSTRHRGVPNGIVEFSLDGKYLGKVIDYREDMGTVSSMSCGKHHFICCGSTGAVAIYGLHEETAIRSNGTTSSPPSSSSSPSSTPFDLLRFQVIHQWPILHSCSIHRAGLDFFFTIDRQNYVGLIIMEQRTCLRTFLNAPFVNAKITCCQLIRDRLYLGLINGYLLTINILPLLSGQMDCGKRLNEFILDRESLFSEECGISTMAVMAPADYFGLIHEDLEHHPLHHQRHGQGQGQGQGHHNSNENYTATNVRIKPRPKLIGMKLKSQKLSNNLTSDETIFQKNSQLKPSRPLEGHILLVAGGDLNPIVRILHPFHPKPATGSAFYQIGELSSHGKAVTQIVCDIAGRFIITSSQGSKTIAIYNGITFNCERTHENVNIGYLGVGENALFGCSFKAPFITIWKPEQTNEEVLETKSHKSYRRKIEPSLSNISDIFNSSVNGDAHGNGHGIGNWNGSQQSPDSPDQRSQRQRQRQQQQEKEDQEEQQQQKEISSDGRPEIAMVRTSVWCLTSVTGGKIIPQKSLAPTYQYLGENGRRVVNNWRSFYDRSVKKVAKGPPMKPSHPSSLKKTKSLPPIQEKSKRKELQRLASGGGGGGGGGSVGGGESMMSWNKGYDLEAIPTVPEDEISESYEDNHSTFQSTIAAGTVTGAASTATTAIGGGASEYDWQTGYDYKHGCYYDENGYAYNYDQNGNYFYYDASWYEQFPSPYQQQQQQSQHQHHHHHHHLQSSQSFTSSPSPQSPPQIPHFSRSPQLAVEDPLGSTMTSDSFVTAPIPFPSQEDLNGGGSNEFLRIGESPFQSHFIDPISPSSPTTLPVETPQHNNSGLENLSSQKKSKKIREDSKDYDRYGKYIGSDLDRYDDDPPSPSQHKSQEEGVHNKSGSKHSLPVISLKRRHMHMSDSESDEEEKMESIYRVKTGKSSKENKKRNQTKKRGNNKDEGEDEDEDEDNELEDEDKSRARANNTSNYDEEEEREVKEDQREEEESVVSISEEKKKYLERERYIQRGLLHHIGDDSDDEDD